MLEHLSRNYPADAGQQDCCAAVRGLVAYDPTRMMKLRGIEHGKARQQIGRRAFYVQSVCPLNRLQSQIGNGVAGLQPFSSAVPSPGQWLSHVRKGAVWPVFTNGRQFD